MTFQKKSVCIAAAAVALVMGTGVAVSTAEAQQAKNVILLISDGQGFNHVLATEMYTGTKAEYHNFDVKLSMATFSATNPNFKNGQPGYDPAQMASNFGYVSQSGTYTDSASAASAMYTGVKIYDNQINMTTDGKALTTFFEQAAKAPFNKSMGAVSSVQITHATPGAVFAHNKSRGNTAQMANEGVYGTNPNSNNDFYDALNYNGNFKVLMGAGNGDYNDNGIYTPSASDSYVGGTTTWEDIKDGAAPNGWNFVDEKSDFEAIANGTYAGGTPDKLLAIAQCNSTLQQSRSNPAGNFDPMNTNVPTLATMTKAALNVLGQNSNGFTVMIEGGAVDWAGHANQLDRMIEEQIDFDNAVTEAVAWVEANSNWNETLIIVTADHETGYLMGAADGSAGYMDVNGNNQFDAGVDYAHLKNNGAGNLPGASWYSGNHTNQLVPLFAKGAGAELFNNYIVGTDANLDNYYGLAANGWTGFDGKYIDNTSIYTVMMEASGVAVPEPATIGILSIGAGALVLRRRSR